MLFLLLIALHNIRWGARASPSPSFFLSISVSRANFNFYVVPALGGALRFRGLLICVLKSRESIVSCILGEETRELTR